MRYIKLILVLLLIAIPLGCGGSDNTEEAKKTIPVVQPSPPPIGSLAELQVHLIDVGQGDAILCDLGEIEVLIDGGDQSHSIKGYLHDYVDGPLEIMVATHPHPDHIGGLIEVLKTFDVLEIWHNGDDTDTKTYDDFMDAVEDEGAEVYVARLHERISAGDLEFYVYSPMLLVDDINSNSIVLYLKYGLVDFLFMGDAGQATEKQLMTLDSVQLPHDVDILKVGHHASRTASSEEFLQIVDPRMAIYTCEEGNSYGHPHQETIDRISSVTWSGYIFGTDKNGTIVVITSGTDVDVDSDRSGGGRYGSLPGLGFGWYNANSPTEIADVQLAVAALMANPTPCVKDLSNDYRINGFVACPDLTQDMRDGGLIDVDEGYSSMIQPVSYYLKKDNSLLWYCVDFDGTVYGYHDEDRENQILCSREEVGAETEFANVQLAIAALMADPDPRIRDLSTDHRISGFSENCLDLTQDMEDGGLIDIADEYVGVVNPPSYYLYCDEVYKWYCVEADGTVHGYYDAEGKDEILP